MITASEALGLILQNIRTLEPEEIPLSGSLCRYLARPVTAPISLPPFDNSAMDGFALRSEETRSARTDAPVSFRVVGTIAAGDPPGKIGPGEACRIMTGAAIPEGADAVVPFEKIPPNPPLTKGGEGGFSTLISITEPVPEGDNVRRAGEDVREGETVLTAGARITPRTIALLAALGVARVPVCRKPRVAILSTGTELVSVRAYGHTPLPPGKIYNSNGPALAAAFEEIGIEAPEIAVAADTEAELKKALSPLVDADVLITVGAVSAGDFDLVPKVLKDLGAEIVFHKVAIKPGKPLLFASLRGMPVFGLPGNPVSALMVFDRFVRPALLKMMGAREIFRVTKSAIASEDLKGSSGKEDYLRGIVEYRDGGYVARSAGSQGSARLLPLAKANAVLVIPEDKKKIAAGETVTFEFLSEGI